MIFKDKKVAVAIAGVLACTLSEQAHATKTITSPYVEQGVLESETKAGYVIDDEDDENRAYEIESSVAYGVTPFWETEIGGSVEDRGEGEKLKFDKVFWENKFQLAPRGEFFVDPGLKVEYGHSLDGEPDEIEAKLLLAKQVGKFDHAANFSVEREVGEDAESELGYGFSYGVAYEHSESFQYGVEWYSDFGNFADDFDDQGHEIGPVVYGDAADLFDYEAGVLFGVSESSPDALLKLVVEKEF